MSEQWWREVPVPGERGFYCGYPVIVGAWTKFGGEWQVVAEYTDTDGVVSDSPDTFSRTLTEGQKAMRLELESES